MVSHKEALKKSWRIAKNNKWLWIFGFLSLAFLGGSEFNLVYQFYKINQQIADIFFVDESLIGYLNVNFGIDFWISLLLLILIVLVINFSQAILFKKSFELSNGNTTNLKELSKVVWKKLGSFLSINIISQGLVYILAFLALIISRFVGDSVYSQTNALILIVSIIVIPFSILVSFVRRYALMFFVENDELSIFTCYKMGLNLFIKRWFESLKTSIISFILLAIFSVLTTMFIAVLVWPTLFLIGRLNLTSETLIQIGGIFILVYSMLVSVFMASFFGTIYYAYWVNIFKQLKK